MSKGQDLGKIVSQEAAMNLARKIDMEVDAILRRESTLLHYITLNYPAWSWDWYYKVIMDSKRDVNKSATFYTVYVKRLFRKPKYIGQIKIHDLDLMKV